MGWWNIDAAREGMVDEWADEAKDVVPVVTTPPIGFVHDEVIRSVAMKGPWPLRPRCGLWVLRSMNVWENKFPISDNIHQCT
jgi:hypothetical protein